MKNKAVLCVLFSWFAVLSKAQNAERVYEKVNKAVVQILAYHNHALVGQGSGVIIKSKNWIVTNFHVISEADMVVAIHNDKYIDTDTILAFDHAKDVCIFRIALAKMDKSILEAIPDIKLISGNNLKVGQKIYAIGSPFGLENTMTDGIISGLRTSVSSTQQYIQISAPISLGSSGGAVVNAKGELVGISTMVMTGKTAQNLNFAILTDDVLEVAKGNIKPSGNVSNEAFYNYYFKQAQIEFQRKDYRATLQNFQKALATNEKTANLETIYRFMGTSYHNIGKLDSAKIYYNKSLKLKPSSETYCGLASIANEEKDNEGAIGFYNQALKLDPKCNEALIEMGMLYYNKREYKIAIIYFSTAVDNIPNNSKALYMLGLFSSMSSDWDLAIYFYQRAIKSKPDYKDAYLGIITAYSAKGDNGNVEVYTKKMKSLGK